MNSIKSLKNTWAKKLSESSSKDFKDSHEMQRLASALQLLHLQQTMPELLNKKHKDYLRDLKQITKKIHRDLERNKTYEIKYHVALEFKNHLAKKLKTERKMLLNNKETRKQLIKKMDNEFGNDAPFSQSLLAFKESESQCEQQALLAKDNTQEPQIVLLTLLQSRSASDVAETITTKFLNIPRDVLRQKDSPKTLNPEHYKRLKTEAFASFAHIAFFIKHEKARKIASDSLNFNKETVDLDMI